jgi:hypothetical protein
VYARAAFIWHVDDEQCFQLHEHAAAWGTLHLEKLFVC